MINNILKRLYKTYTYINIMNNINNISNISNISNIYNKCKPLYTTSESQGHGKAFEKEIQDKIFELSNVQIESYKSNAIYDIPKEGNNYKNDKNIIYNKNISIKTTGNNSVYCGDIKRFLESDNLTMIIIKYKQSGNYKIVDKTIIITHDDIMNIIKTQLKTNNIEYNNWKNHVNNLTENVKKIQHGKVLECDKNYKSIAKELSRNLDFSINCKVDSDKQRRVQCSINIDKCKNLDSYKAFDGAMIYDKKYNNMIFSPPRNRNGLTIPKLKELCKTHSIWKKNNRVLYYETIKVSDLKKDHLKKYVQEKIPEELKKYCDDNGIEMK